MVESLVQCPMVSREKSPLSNVGLMKWLDSDEVRFEDDAGGGNACGDCE